MSTIKRLQREDVTSARTQLHETIPVTGSLISGTYGPGTLVRGLNIKTYDHGMFQSVFDYPFLSSSANQIFDLTLGINKRGHFPTTLQSGTTDKHNIYDQMAQVLYGFDITGTVEQFRTSGSYDATLSSIDSPMFINFSRLLSKDEIQKGSFRLVLGGGTYAAADTFLEKKLFYLGDFGATASFNDTNSPAGEYGIIRSGSSTTDTTAANNDALGIIYYQAGVVVLDMSSSIHAFTNKIGSSGDDFQFISSSAIHSTFLPYTGSVESGTIDQVADALRHRIFNIEFNNTTELNSTIYFCRAGANEFNYSSNPTYLTGSKIRVKEDIPENPPISYITTVGLYADDGALVATAKLSEPLKKTTTDSLTLRVRLDY